LEPAPAISAVAEPAPRPVAEVPAAEAAYLAPTPTPTPIPVPVTAKVDERPMPAKAAQPIDASTLQSVVESAGLQWVQTAPSAMATDAEPVTPAAPRAPRVRKPRVAAPSEPLMQVETQNPPGDA
jgi:ribonuclease E